MSRKSTAKPTLNQVRIVGGKWRGRKLQFPSVEGLRPTGDRIRETLFNWLGQNLSGTRILDLFAGSGVLGVEALSRGADFVQFVDADRGACRSLEESLKSLAAENFSVVHKKAEGFLLSVKSNSVDILFLDPPFASNQLSTICEQIGQSEILTNRALIYVETPRNMEPALPKTWKTLKKKSAGDVCYQLLQADCGNAPI